MAQFSLHTPSHSLNKTYSPYALIAHGTVLNKGIIIQACIVHWRYFLYFPFFPFPHLCWSFLSSFPLPCNVYTHDFLDVNSGTTCKKIGCLSFWGWLDSPKVSDSGCIHFSAKDTNFFILYSWKILSHIKIFISIIYCISYVIYILHIYVVVMISW